METDLKCKCAYCDLRNLFFSHVDPELLEGICHSRIERSYSKGDPIVNAGEKVRDFMYLKEGLVKLFRTTDSNKSQIIAIGKPLDFLSLITVFDSDTFKYSVTALEDSVICILDIDFVKKTAINNGSFAMDMMKMMSRSADEIISNFLELRKKQLKGRIAQILLFFAVDVYNKNCFELPISRKEIADYIGMTTENVIRSLSEFRKDGLIHIYGKYIEIIDLALLRRISEHG